MGWLNKLVSKKPKRWYSEQIRGLIDELHSLQLLIDAKEKTLSPEYRAIAEKTSDELKVGLTRGKIVHLSDRKQFNTAFEIARLREKQEIIASQIAELEERKKKAPSS